jgi:hypothetical protein
VQPGLFPRIKVSHENVGVQPAFLTDSLARLFTRFSPCFCTEPAGGAAPGVNGGPGYGGEVCGGSSFLNSVDARLRP